MPSSTYSGPIPNPDHYVNANGKMLITLTGEINTAAPNFSLADMIGHGGGA